MRADFIGGEAKEEIVIPGAQEAKIFWIDIWGQEVEHRKVATLLREIKKDMNGKKKQAQVQISQEKLKKTLNNIPYRKAPEPDGVQEFWLKNFTSLHNNLVWHLNACLEGKTPQWRLKEESTYTKR